MYARTTILLLALLLTSSTASFPEPSTSIAATCVTSQTIFSPSSLACTPCPIEGTVPNSSGSECECPSNSVATRDADGVVTGCAACASGSGPSQDGESCLPCGTPANSSLVLGVSAATYDSGSGTCVCDAPNGVAKVEASPSGGVLPSVECVSCPADHVVGPDGYGCVPCQTGALRGPADAGGVCTCAGPVYAPSPLPDVCLLSGPYAELSTSYPAADAARVTFGDVQDADGDWRAPVTISSWIFGKYFPAAATGCFAGSGDETACQTLGNLCVLANYNDDAPACALFASIANARPGNVNGYDDWKVGLPWLEYGSAFAVLRSYDVASKFTFSQDEESAGKAIYNVRYVLASYTLNGTFVGLDDVTFELQKCRAPAALASRWRRFGTNYYEKCVVDLAPIAARAASPLAEKDILLHDLYLADLAGNLVPVPVRLANLRRGGSAVNVDTSEFNDVLVRRFYLQDAVTGKRSEDAGPDVVRIAAKVMVTVTLQDSGDGLIRPPVLDLFMTERLGSSISAVPPEDAFTESESRPMISFASVYTMDLTTFWRNVSIVFGMVLFVAVLFWLVRVYAWIQRNKSVVGTEFLGPLCGYLFASLGFVLFWFVYGVTMYWFIVFKWQATVSVLLPTSSAHQTLYAVLGTAFSCQFLAVMYMIYKQASVDVFLMDWERPKGQVVPKDGDIRNAQPASISIWRTFFIANEWHELQAVRKISLELTLFAVLFLLEGVGLSALASPQPAFTDLTPLPPNVILRFALTSSFWLGLGLVQMVFNFLIVDRFFDNAAIDFVDLLSLSNISVFVLHERYAGYYLHGRSIYQHTDVSMREMGANLQEEMEGMAPPRGLGENSDCQTFEMFVTQQFRDAFDDCYGDVTNNFSLIPCAKKAPSRAPRGPPRATGPGARLGEAVPGEPRRNQSGPSDQTLAAYSRVNSFLTEFIDRHGSSPGADAGYRIETRPAISKLLRVPPDMGHGACVLNPSSLTSFTNVTLYGIELPLLLLNIMVFALSDIAFNNTFISALIVWLVEQFIVRLRTWMGAKNMTQKTLVDERFLA